MCIIHSRAPIVTATVNYLPSAIVIRPRHGISFARKPQKFHCVPHFVMDGGAVKNQIVE